MPSQYGEEFHILDHFKGRKGRFLDIGAYDGLTYSNTRCLMEEGWSGVCVEPNPLILPYLQDHTERFPLISTLQAAILPDTFQGRPRMWITQDATSSFIPEHIETINRHNPKIKFKPVAVPTLRWHEFLKVYPQPYDFINIDVEGMNWEVLRDGPLAEMVCVEMDPPCQRERMKEHFRIFGMDNQCEIGGNLLAWR